jgi:serpin B
MYSIRSGPCSVFGLLVSIAVAAVAYLEINNPAHGQMRCSSKVARHRIIGAYRTDERRQSVVEITQPDDAKANDGLKKASAAKITSDVKAAAQSNNQFAFDLYKQSKEPIGNQIFSPVSISTGLAMISAGAKGETKKQMSQVLHLDLPDPNVQTGFGKLNAILNTQSKNYRLNMANRLWGQKGFRFEPQFVKLTSENYGAELGIVDFAEPEQARQTINQWTAAHTGGKIPELLPHGLLNGNVRFVLTNASYFKGTWQYRFAKETTRDAVFHDLKNREVKVPMMNQTGAFQYGENADLQVLELPYVGGELSMVILLPKKVDGLLALYKKLTASDVQKWASGLEHVDEVEIYMPKFTFTTQIRLKDVLSSMGMPLAFSDAADFSGITTQQEQKLYESIHQAFVDVNEEGTEAAAVTGHVGGNAPGPVPRHVVFRADHPFLFLIQDKRTGAILFLGRVANPNG